MVDIWEVFLVAYKLHFDHIIAKPILDNGEDFKAYCKHKTEFSFDVLGDTGMRQLKKGDYSGNLFYLR